MSTTDVDEKRYTERGFRIFTEFSTPRGTVTVQESSLAFEGAHAWIFKNGEGIQVSAKDAERIIEALQRFVAEAKAGELVEPYGYAESEE